MSNVVSMCKCECPQPITREGMSVCIICTKEILIVKVSLDKVAVDMIIKQFLPGDMDEINEIEEVFLDKHWS